MRTRFTVTPGASLRGVGLQTGMAYGVEIDNPSGSWLSIPSFDTFIPPYTIGWALALPIAVQSIDVLAVNGPAGQLSTSEGDFVVIYLSDVRVPTSPGSPDPGHAFVTKSDQPERSTFAFSNPIPASGILNTVNPGFANTTLLAGSLTRRLRIYGCVIQNGEIETQRVQGDITFILGDDAGGNVIGGAQINANNQTYNIPFPFGFVDLRPGREARLSWDVVIGQGHALMIAVLTYAIY